MDKPLSSFAFNFNLRRCKVVLKEYPELQSRFRKHAIRTLFREELAWLTLVHFQLNLSRFGQ